MLLEKLGTRLSSTANTTSNTIATAHTYETLAKVYKVISLLKESEKVRYIYTEREDNAPQTRLNALYIASP